MDGPGSTGSSGDFHEPADKGQLRRVSGQDEVHKMHCGHVEVPRVNHGVVSASGLAHVFASLAKHRE
jgi:hypothetical protein